MDERRAHKPNLWGVAGFAVVLAGTLLMTAKRTPLAPALSPKVEPQDGAPHKLITAAEFRRARDEHIAAARMGALAPLVALAIIGMIAFAMGLLVQGPQSGDATRIGDPWAALRTAALGFAGDDPRGFTLDALGVVFTIAIAVAAAEAFDTRRLARLLADRMWRTSLVSSAAVLTAINLVALGSVLATDFRREVLGPATIPVFAFTSLSWIVTAAISWRVAYPFAAAETEVETADTRSAADKLKHAEESSKISSTGPFAAMVGAYLLATATGIWSGASLWPPALASRSIAPAVVLLSLVVASRWMGASTAESWARSRSSWGWHPWGLYGLLWVFLSIFWVLYAAVFATVSAVQYDWQFLMVFSLAFSPLPYLAWAHRPRRLSGAEGYGPCADYARRARIRLEGRLAATARE